MNTKMKPLVLNAQQAAHFASLPDGGKMVVVLPMKKQPALFRKNNTIPVYEDGGVYDDILPPCRPGDNLWIKEELNGVGMPDGRRPGIVRYSVDGKMVIANDQDHIWYYKRDSLPAPFMPRWAARHSATVEDVQAVRVQDMTEEQAKLAGFTDDSEWNWELASFIHANKNKLRLADDWDKRHKKRPWDSSPWTWAITITKETQK